MIIKVLIENTTHSDSIGSEHGLSLYIETAAHKILFDTGASSLFAENAVKMGVDLTKVDLVAISHGHYDHGGGLKSFLQINNTAKIYLHQKAFKPYYANGLDGTKVYIGLDQALLPNERFIFCGDHHVIDEALELFSGVSARRYAPSCNGDLLMKEGAVYVQDDLTHEQNLIVHENGTAVLIAGCAHNGIINIIDRFAEEKGCPPDYVIGGFHLYSHGTKQNESPKIVDEIGQILLETGAQYYTGHCTGSVSYKRLKAVMGERIDYLSAGDELELNTLVNQES